MPMTRISAVGYHQPEHVMTNDDLAGMVDTSDAWIRQRTGITSRRVARDESVQDMAVTAAGKAMAAAGLAPDEIGQVIVATCSAVDRVPSVAAQVAGRLGVPSAVAFDLNNGCAGFTTALATAEHGVRAGAVRHALVIGAEKMSAVADWTDRTTCVLLADGAGAAVVSASDEEGIGPVVWGSDPTRRDMVRMQDEWRPRFAQEGQSVFRWATTELAPFAREACARAGIAPGELAGIVTHQANLRIIEALARAIDAPNAVVARDVTVSGNTSAASVPLALAKLVERREVPVGAPVLLFAFGGGLAWAGQVVHCP
ncbi:beta-ketoacyl-ACP synthase III [Streptomyces sp. PT12]|uniref:beta-ketoacyl-ACP synthase III n=1 Tax=Streptomyces sp. PT12 TaxID=1510197 RepID=UPI000DE22587|nr:beta-ketoacyl-ACP synthase III [Streptomyces sp. PT12]RBM19001.1 3-oxoacyl-ACP synthase [Streptomyces sp. PT12]